MKNTYTKFFMLLLSFAGFAQGDSGSASQQESNPLLVILIMVKDEEAVIEKTLESYIPHYLKNGADTGEIAYILYDTGSTDKTIELTEGIFKKYGLKHAFIAKDIWVDFAVSRNKALEIARSAYPQSSFIFFPDAEWYLHTIDELLAFCKGEKAAFSAGLKTPPPYYSMRMTKPGVYVSLTGRLFLTADDVHFEKGIDVHECPTKCTSCHTPSSVYIELGTSKEGNEKSAARWHRDREKMIKRLELDPTNPRTVSYLAKTEQWLGNNKDAYKYFKMRKGMPTFPQEDYETLYHLGEVTEILSHDDPEHFTWQEALSYYLDAYMMRPHRAEALVRIARHYLDENQFALSYMFAKRSTELTMAEPEKEILPINLYIYDYLRWELLSRAAWYVQEYEVGGAAAQKAIEARPNMPHLYKNLSYYWERKQNAATA